MVLQYPCSRDAYRNGHSYSDGCGGKPYSIGSRVSELHSNKLPQIAMSIEDLQLLN